MAVPLLVPERRWECPNCNFKQVTRIPEEHTRFHACSGLKGLTAPMVPAGTDCVVRAVEREDYVYNENVTYDGEGRPIMRVETIHADGHNDVAVMAPCAGVKGEVS